MIRVTVWNENIHEKEIPEQMAHYPRRIHGAIAEYLQKAPMSSMSGSPHRISRRAVFPTMC